jgi:hypothetical protein
MVAKTCKAGWAATESGKSQPSASMASKPAIRFRILLIAAPGQTGKMAGMIKNEHRRFAGAISSPLCPAFAGVEPIKPAWLQPATR